MFCSCFQCYSNCDVSCAKYCNNHNRSALYCVVRLYSLYAQFVFMRKWAWLMRLKATEKPLLQTTLPNTKKVITSHVVEAKVRNNLAWYTATCMQLQSLPASHAGRLWKQRDAINQLARLYQRLHTFPYFFTFSFSIFKTTPSSSIALANCELHLTFLPIPLSATSTSEGSQPDLVQTKLVLEREHICMSEPSLRF